MAGKTKEKTVLDSWLKANPYPKTPDPFGPEAARARLEEEKRLRSALGYAQTILTTPRGVGRVRTAGSRLGSGL